MKIYANDNLVYDKDFTDTPLRSIAVDTAQGRVAVIPISDQNLPIHLTFEFVSLANMVVPTLVNKEELAALTKKVQDAVEDETNFDDESKSKKAEKEAEKKVELTEAEKLEAAKKAEAEANAETKRKDDKLKDEAIAASNTHPVSPIHNPVSPNLTHPVSPVHNPSSFDKK